MRIKSWALVAPLLATISFSAATANAQETLAGVGAASGMGATLGAASAGSMGGALNGARGAGSAMPGGDLGDDKGGVPTFPNGGAGTVTRTTTTTTRVTTPLAGRSGTGGAILGQLLKVPNRPTPVRKLRSARSQSAYSRRVAKLSPAARKKLVLQKYKIPARGYLSSYLLADRYKFAKAWKYVSTETDTFYYRPQDMARRSFNPNRVIGFRTWQDAMLAGYRPDPVSKPEPGNQLAYLASLTRDDALTQYVEYVYAGQVSPASVTNTTNYVRRVKGVIDRNPSARKYQRETVNSILMASLTGDSSLIPRQLGGGNISSGVVSNAGMMGSGMMGSGGGAPAMMAPGGGKSAGGLMAGNER